MTTLADYSFYTSEYGGDVVPLSAFPRVSAKATAYINNITQGRAAKVTDSTTLNLVKFAVCAVADLMYRAEYGAGGLPQSEGIGGDYSATYTQEKAETRYYKAARPFLSGTGLLYWGV